MNDFQQFQTSEDFTTQNHHQPHFKRQCNIKAKQFKNLNKEQHKNMRKNHIF